MEGRIREAAYLGLKKEADKEKIEINEVKPFRVVEEYEEVSTNSTNGYSNSEISENIYSFIKMS